MMSEESHEQSLQVSPRQLLALVAALSGASPGREDDEHPLPPGPWDPVIRLALERIGVFGPHPEPWIGGDRGRRPGATFGPSPDPWRFAVASLLARHPELWDVVGGGHGAGEEVALNPQPLPPRQAFMSALAQGVVARAELMQELAEATRQAGQEQGIIIVSGYIGRFADDYCGSEVRLRWPFPGPRPHWFPREPDGADRLVIAAQFARAAEASYGRELRLSLAQASTRLVAAGLAKLR